MMKDPRVRIYGFVVLVIFGFLSLLFSLWNSSSNSTDWHIPVDPTTKKGPDEYDVIVVGGGFGGLASGAFLAHHGYKVLLFDKNEVLGGVCTSYSEHGYTFSYGAEDIMGLSFWGPLNYLFQELGISQNDFFIRNDRKLIGTTGSLYVPAESFAFQEALAQKFPEERTAINDFFAMARSVYQEAFDKDMVARWGIIVPPPLWKRAMGPTWVSEYPKRHSNLIEWSKRSYQEVIDEYFINSDIKNLLSSLVGYLGRRPVDVAASDVVIQTFGAFFYGGFHALGSPSRVAEALAKYISSRGGTVLRRVYVDEIEYADDRVQGVRVDGKHYSAPIVIANVNVKTLFSEMMPQGQEQQRYLESLRDVPYARAPFCVHFAVQDPLEGYPAIIQDRENIVSISIPSAHDPSLAPQGCSTVITRKFVHYMDFLGKSEEEYIEFSRALTEQLIEATLTMVPGMRDRYTVVKVASPLTYELIANIPNGAVFGYDTIDTGSRPYFKTPFPGLYLASASSSGAGVKAVVSEGLLCAHDIMGWKD